MFNDDDVTWCFYRWWKSSRKRMDWNMIGIGGWCENDWLMLIYAQICDGVLTSQIHYSSVLRFQNHFDISDLQENLLLRWMGMNQFDNIQKGNSLQILQFILDCLFHQQIQLFAHQNDSISYLLSKEFQETQEAKILDTSVRCYWKLSSRGFSSSSQCH